jgi:hypothetical protein
MARHHLFTGTTLALLAALAVGCGLAPTAQTPAAITGQLSFAPGVRSTGLKAFHGIEHTHVAENGDDGQGTLDEAYTFARENAKLDFMGVSSHSHMISDQGYGVMKAKAAQHTQNGKFVALLGQEWSSISKGGHINIYEANERCPLGNGDWDAFYERWLPAHPEVAFVQFNHPHPSNPLEFGGKDFLPQAQIRESVVAVNKVTAMALLNGPGKYDKHDMGGQPDEWDRGINKLNYEEEYKEFLNRGWRIGAVGDQDNHVKSWGLAVPTRTGVWAKSLTKADLLDGFAKRRTFAAFDPNAELFLSINGKDMGSEFAASGELAVTVEANDPDTVITRLELYGDTDGVGGAPAKLLAKTAVGKKAAKWELKVPAAGADSYYFAKLVYGDTTAWAWSSPIWVDQPTRAARKKVK